MNKVYYLIEDSMRNVVVYILSPNFKNWLQTEVAQTKTLGH